MSLLERVLKVTDIGLKGKAKIPTVVMASGDGEKVILKFEVKQQLDGFKLDDEFTVKVSRGGQTKLDGAK